MDGRGRFMDNIFIERLWRSIKYRRSASEGLRRWLRGAVRHQFLDGRISTIFSPHQAMNNQMPMAVWRAGIDKSCGRRGLWICPLRLDNAKTRCPHTHSREQQRERLDTLKDIRQARLHLSLKRHLGSHE